ncbi:MAG: chemotaxis protein CheA [Acetobacteraceae bacterium]|nr:MAG: chemotaxis protein CheA [Acetobacteraceae bacterium]
MSAPADATETFRQEAGELLEELEQALLDLGQTLDDRSLVDTVFRAMHTIKGSGAMFGFEAIAGFTHDFETAFDQVRKGLTSCSRDLIGAGLRATDHIRTLLNRPEAADPATGEAILVALHRALAEASDGAETAEGAPAARTAAAGQWRITFRLATDALVNGTKPLIMLDELRELGKARIVALVDAVPALDVMDPDSCALGWDVVLSTDRPRSSIEEVFLFVSDDASIKIVDLSGSGTPAPVPATGGDRAGVAPVAERARSEPEAGKVGSSLRVQAERLDELMDRVGELVIAQARLSQLAGVGDDGNLTTVAEEIERLVSELRDTTMSIRMLPIGSLFARYRRLLHDLSRDLGKSVELVTSGEDTELDKTVIERLADPLVHLIRNAVDHGLETPEQRLATGKAEGGTLRLAARYSGAEVLVTVSDDGRGLNAERIRAKAVEQGLIGAEAKLPDHELHQLLFHPGFSTAQEISAISGRGVGMDVVKRAIEALRGSIDITTVPGRGTEVTLRLPLTLAIIEGLLVRVGKARYAIPLSAVEECVELPATEEQRSHGRSFLNIRGALVPFLRLRELLQADTPPDPHQKVVIIATGEQRVGLVVDQIIGSHQTVIKSLSTLHADVETFSGATILGDGTVALIFDVSHLLEVGQAHEERTRVLRREAA